MANDGGVDAAALGLSPLRLKKLRRRFAVTDIDKSGYIDHNDYARLAQHFSKLNGLQAGSAEAQQFAATYHDAWERLRRGADADGDGRVSPAEYIAYFAQEVNVRLYLDELREQLLKMMDTDGDGRISRDEYVANSRVAGAPEAYATDLFGRLDRNGDGYLSREELHLAMEEYYLGDDPDAPGNGLLGPLD